ncbi:hypothetical protein Q3G72_034811 [Acer saccharum]|nr:hypothetical protein Q3G72_034811 [Acer saccharum]
MQGGLSLLGGGGGGGSSNESTVVSKVSCCGGESSESGDELELGLGLSLGGGGCCAGKSKASAWGECGRILTAKDFPCVVNNNRSPPINASVSGTKRSAVDSVPHDTGSPPPPSQVVGWPPVGTHRKSSFVNQAKAPRSEEDKVGSEKDKSKDASKKKICNGNKSSHVIFNEKGHIGFVKVNMDGIPIGRKVDLNAHACYQTLAQTLEDMFFGTPKSINPVGSGGEKDPATNPSKLLDGSSEFVLTYEDKEGDWMLVGDVPWRMFLSSVKRLRIMRTSEANGLAPRFQERTSERQRAKPV